ncbi:MAG: winged helix-turn-helix transcriptional regulator [Gammaproteobacteria bacterium]|nr:winged helix-turn-helix transcriptional regulator [Gammaproteobacteria bacterium]
MTEDALSGQSKTLVRGLSILNVCAKSRRGLTLVEIAEATELAPSTVHRLLTALEALEYLVCETDTGWISGGQCLYPITRLCQSNSALDGGVG